MSNVVHEDNFSDMTQDRHYLYVKYGLANIHKKKLGERRWSNYFRFAFVRNPWDRYVSSWSSFHPKWDFAEYVERVGISLESTFDGYENDRWHALPQHLHLIDDNGRLLVDFVGRFETLQTDFDHICDQINVPRVVLPKLNRSKHKHYSQYYTDELREIVALRHKKDIEMFEYKFEGA